MVWDDFINEPYETFVSYLHNNGYHTVCINGYDEKYYNRYHVYPNMGFDKCIFIDDFVNSLKYNGYISDIAITDEILNTLKLGENEFGDEPLFIYAMTVQNHVYDLELKQNSSDAKYVDINWGDVKVSNKSKEDVYEYVNGLWVSVMGLNNLLDYLDETERDTLVVFWGDHAPGFDGLDYKTYYDNDHLYKTPYLIWSNHQNNYIQPENIELYQLSTLLVDYLHLPQTMCTYKNNYFMNKDYVDDAEYKRDVIDEIKMYNYMREFDSMNRYMWGDMKYQSELYE